MKIAVLFDVDLTLVDAKRSGSKAMRRAFEELWGWPDATGGISMGGRTDRAIFRDVVGLRLGRIPAPDELAEMLATFTTRYYELLAAQLGRTPAEPCPGIPEVLDRVCGIAGLSPGLATGNFRRGAELKMRSASIDPGRFPYGGFGDSFEDRADLVRRAIERATTHAGEPVRPVVLGDTPRDHAAARACGALSALVGTGLGDYGQLEALGPDFIEPSLEDPSRFLGWLASVGG